MNAFIAVPIGNTNSGRQKVLTRPTFASDKSKQGHFVTYTAARSRG